MPKSSFPPKSIPPKSSPRPTVRPGAAAPVARKLPSGMFRQVDPNASRDALLEQLRKKEHELAMIRTLIEEKAEPVPERLIVVGTEYSTYPAKGRQRIPVVVVRIYTSDDNLDDKLYYVERTDREVHRGPAMVRRAEEIYPPLMVTLLPPPLP